MIDVMIGTTLSGVIIMIKIFFSFSVVLTTLLTLDAHSGYAHFWEDGGASSVEPFARYAVTSSGLPSNFVLSGANCNMTDPRGDLQAPAVISAGLAICRMALKVRTSGGTCSVGANNTFICTGDIALGSCTQDGKMTTCN